MPPKSIPLLQKINEYIIFYKLPEQATKRIMPAKRPIGWQKKSCMNFLHFLRLCPDHLNWLFLFQLDNNLKIVQLIKNQKYRNKWINTLCTQNRLSRQRHTKSDLKIRGGRNFRQSLYRVNGIIWNRGYFKNQTQKIKNSYNSQVREAISTQKSYVAFLQLKYWSL